MEVLHDLLHRGIDVADVGVAGLGERSRYTDVDAVAGLQSAEVGGCGEQSLFDERRELPTLDVAHVALPARELLHFRGIEVDADDFEAAVRVLHGQREAHVTQPDDGELRSAVLQFFR